jgi:hypothetical protein
MIKSPHIYNIFCGESCSGVKEEGNNILLSYFDGEDYKANISMKLTRFTDNLDNIEDKIIDLLEIATYVFSADKAISRGKRTDLNYVGWARTFKFHIPVRDVFFWNNPNMLSALSSALKFISGDNEFVFTFTKSKLKTINQPSLFSNDILLYNNNSNNRIILFSGGLDSLAGVIESLNMDHNLFVYLVSHKSNHKVIKTQKILVDYLKQKYTSRINEFNFDCHFKHYREEEGTQRSRMFLFSAIAFAICSSYKKDDFYIYENGITSINLPKQGDVMNARASRTTHPKTIFLLNEFYKYFGQRYSILTPYINKTKKDVIEIIKNNNESSIISSSISCSTVRDSRIHSHCGICSQCIDRRFAVFALDLEEYDEVYEKDFISCDNDKETRNRLYGTIRLAAMEEIKSKSDFIKKYATELFDVIDYLPQDNPPDIKVDKLYNFYCRYGEYILGSLKKIQNKHEDLSKVLPHNSLLEIIANREHLKTPLLNRINEIDKKLKCSIPILFKDVQPKNEKDFNNKVQALFIHDNPLVREYPPIKFGITEYRPDHSKDELLIEAKYIRGKTTPSKITDGIAADITKAHDALGLLFIVYDPERSIVPDDDFINSFQKKRDNCYVKIYR